MNRRHFLKSAGAAGAFFALPRAIRAQTAAPRVVIVGGGFAGATVAKYLKLWGGNIDVTMIERAPLHYACILSNLVVTGQLPMDRIKLYYDSLVDKRGVKFVLGEAAAVDPSARTVTVQTSAGFSALPYDKLILAPGIDFITPAGNYNADLTPHAWKAGPQTLLLKNQLAAMKAGGTFIMNVPKAPYRCPPGPYERACVIADYLKRRKRGSRIIVLDANPGITAEPIAFGRAFSQTYAGVLEYRPNSPVLSVDSTAKTVSTPQGVLKGALLNIIPDQKAGPIVFGAGLVNDASGKWAAVDPLTYASTAQPDIHVLGDSQATGQPKSGHMANSQAKVCADAIVRAFAGEAPDPAPVTNSACFSPINSKTASWLTVAFQYDPATRAMKRVEESFGEAPKVDSDNLQQMFHWADNIFADSFR